ncbi:MAG TPA: hypothetical protein VGM63_17975, partial [Mucilaginibacter sp.]
MKIALGILFIIGFMGFNNKLFAQKSLLDNSSAENWPTIKNPNISNNGRYIVYLKQQGNAGAQLIVQDTAGKWKKEIATSDYNYQFTNDSRSIICKMANDSVALLELGRPTIRYIENVDKYETPTGGTGRWLACQLKGPQHELMVLDLQQNKETKYLGVQQFQFSDNGDVLLMQTINDKDKLSEFYWVNLNSGKKIHLGSRYINTRNAVFDITGT